MFIWVFTEELVKHKVFENSWVNPLLVDELIRLRKVIGQVKSWTFSQSHYSLQEQYVPCPHNEHCSCPERVSYQGICVLGCWNLIKFHSESLLKFLDRRWLVAWLHNLESTYTAKRDLLKPEQLNPQEETKEAWDLSVKILGDHLQQECGIINFNIKEKKDIKRKTVIFVFFKDNV